MRGIGISAIGLLVTVAAAPLAAQDWIGSIEGGIYSTDRTNTDTDIVGSPFNGLFLGGQTQRDFGAYRLSIDGRVELTDDEGLDDVYESGPLHSGVIGLHFGRVFDRAYLGAFASVGYFDGYDSDKPMTGSLYGLEGSYTLPVGAMLYAQVGAMNAIGDPGDNEYIGYAGRIGAQHRFSDRIKAGLSYEFGRSGDCFVDCGDQPGEFSMIALDAAYSVTDKMDIVARYSYLDVYDVNDDDRGTESNIYLGAKWNFGPRSGQTALTTPMGGFQTAGWMSPLD